MDTVADPASTLSPGHLLAFVALFIVTLAETGRLPVDNPGTHLELTMIHEAMILEYSGRYLALLEWAAAIKLLVFFTLLGNLFVPWGVARAATGEALLVALGSFLLKLLGPGRHRRRLRDARRQAPPLPRPGAPQRLVRPGPPRGLVLLPPAVT